MNNSIFENIAVRLLLDHVSALDFIDDSDGGSLIRATTDLPEVEHWGILRHPGDQFWHPDMFRKAERAHERPMILCEWNDPQHGPGYVWAPWHPIERLSDEFFPVSVEEIREAALLAIQISAGEISVEMGDVS